jgi:sulfite reductase alpha subunit-like flavoprotein
MIAARARYLSCQSTANVSISDVASHPLLNQDPLVDEKYHTAVVKCNTRITAEDWFQDVRHCEFSLKEDVKYEAADRQ